MRKKLLIILLFLLVIPTAFAGYEDYYLFSDNLDVKFVPAEGMAAKSGGAEYRRILKNEKYMQKGNYQKAEKYYPDFIPNIARFVNIYTESKDYAKALNYAKKLEELDETNLFPESSKNFITGILYSLNGNYTASNEYLKPLIDRNSYVKFQMAQNYYFMHDTKSAEALAAQISRKEEAFLPAQELLYVIYSLGKNTPKAYVVAKNLVLSDPGNAQNYIKVASSASGDEEKLINYRRAKQIYYSQELINMISGVNDLIAPLEQAKIDNAYKKITSYCKKPDWYKIKSRNAGMLSDDVVYWDKRQDEFFETALDCISRYKNSDLAACFKDLNDTQMQMDSTLAAENSRRIEAAQREVQIRQLIKQNMLMEEQNMIQWSHYNSYYPYYYYRYPFWW